MLAVIAISPFGAGQSNLELTIQLGHKSEGIRTFQFSPDGSKIVTSSGELTARIWDSRTGKLLVTISGHEKGITHASFSPASDKIATASYDGTARIWDLLTGRQLLTLKGHTDSVMQVVFAEETSMVSTASQDGTVKLWDANTGANTSTIRVHDASEVLTFLEIAVSPNSDRIVTWSGEIAVVPLVQVWNAHTGEELFRLEGHSKYLHSLFFSADGTRIVSASADGTARIWSAKDGSEILQVSHGAGITCAAFVPGRERIVTSGMDFYERGDVFISSSVRVWDLNGQELLRMPGKVPYDRPGDILGRNYYDWVAASSAGDRLAASIGGEVRVWGLDGTHMVTISGSEKPLRDAVPSPNGGAIALATDSEVRVFDVGFGGFSSIIDMKDARLTSAFYSHAGDFIVTTSADGVLKFWDAESGEDIGGGDFGGIIESASLSRDDERLLVFTEYQEPAITVWDIAEAELLFGLEKQNITTSASLSPDGDMVLVTSWLDAGIWSVSSGEKVVKFALPDSRKWVSGSYSPDGRTVVTTGEDFHARIWDANSGEPIRAFRTRGRYVEDAVFSPDGTRLVVVARSDPISGYSPRSLVIFDVESGTEVSHIDSLSLLSSVSFLRGPRFLLTSSRDGAARIYSASMGEELCSLVSFRDGSWAVVDPEGRFDTSDPNYIDGLHWVYTDPDKHILEVIELNQFSKYYFEPRLLGKILDGEELDPVPDLSNLKLFPEVKDVRIEGTTLKAEVIERGGGVGLIRVLLNGQEVRVLNAHGKREFEGGELSLDLSDDLEGVLEPRVTVLAFNDEGSLSGRAGGSTAGRTPAKRDTSPTRFVAVIAGIENYAGESLQLRWSEDDAVAMTEALLIGARGLKLDEIAIYLLCESADAKALADEHEEIQRTDPSRENFETVFTELAKTEFTSNDLLLVFLAGHGTAISDQDQQTYLYLTKEARSGLAQDFRDEQIRSQHAVSSDDLVGWLRKLKAGKRAVILDTCAAGASADALADLRDEVADQKRAMAEFQARTGVHALLGCPENLASFEASEYGHGLLTYSLLYSMKNEELGDDRSKGSILIDRLFARAASGARQRAKEIGRSQDPKIVAPKGDSFPIGFLEEGARSEIPLPEKRPVFVFPGLVNADLFADDLELSNRLDDALRDLMQRSARGSGSAFAVRTNLRDLAQGFYRVQGSYVVDGEVITIRCHVWTKDADGKVVQVGDPMPAVVTTVEKAGEDVLEALREWLTNRKVVLEAWRELQLSMS